MMELLVDHGADVNAGAGWTPLMHAARDGNPDMVRLFLRHGAHVNQTLAGRSGESSMSQELRLRTREAADTQRQSQDAHYRTRRRALRP